MLEKQIEDSWMAIEALFKIFREKGNEPKESLKFLMNHKDVIHYSYNLIHSRILLVDQEIVLVSSADMTHDSLDGQLNTGIVTNKLELVKKCSKFIDATIKKATKTQ